MTDILESIRLAMESENIDPNKIDAVISTVSGINLGNSEGEPSFLIWLDDERDPKNFSDREGWVWVKTAAACIALLRDLNGNVHTLSLDHDLGPVEAGSGYSVVCWLESQAWDGNTDVLPQHIQIHSANPVGRQNMQSAIDSIKRAIQNV